VSPTAGPEGAGAQPSNPAQVEPVSDRNQRRRTQGEGPVQPGGCDYRNRTEPRRQARPRREPPRKRGANATITLSKKRNCGEDSKNSFPAVMAMLSFPRFLSVPFEQLAQALQFVRSSLPLPRIVESGPTPEPSKKSANESRRAALHLLPEGRPR